MDSLLLAGAAAFGLGALAVGWLGRGREGRARLLAVIVTLVPVSVGTWYLAMATGWAVTAGDRVVYWGRFADGVLTIPLLVLVLGLLAGADRTTLGTGVAVSAHSMAATLAASLVTGTAKLLWLGVAVGSFLAMLWVIFDPFTTAARTNDGAAGSFARVRNATVALFLLYPGVWLLGEPGFALAPGDWLVPVRLGLDIALKIGVPALVLVSLGASAQSSRASDASRASS